MIASILPDTFMLERITQRIFRYRLAGTRICGQFQTEFRGLDFLDGWSQADRDIIEHVLMEVTGKAGAALITLECSADEGETVIFEMIILPLIHTNDTIDRYLGAITPIDKPRWLGSKPLKGKKLVRHEIVWPDGRPFVIVEKADRQVPFLPHIRQARIVRNSRRQFRVYEGGLSKSDGDKI